MCRHVFEHIPQPEVFLSQITEALREHEDVPFFLEVPDLGWIVQEHAFWDFCYEHVNYFTPATLRACVAAAGAAVRQVRRAFGDQDLWGELVLNPSPATRALLSSSQENSNQFEPGAVTTDLRLEETASRLAKLRRDRQLAIWGMATKGIMLSLQLIQRGVPVDCAVDINPTKQGRFTPLTGLRIVAPAELATAQPLTVVVMNPNYAAEIAAQCRHLGLHAGLYAADGAPLSR